MAKLGRIALRDREAVFVTLFENISPSSLRRAGLSHDCFSMSFPSSLRRCVLLPSPRAAAGWGRGWGGSAGTQAAVEYAEAPPTPDPSPPRAARAGGGEKL